MHSRNWVKTLAALALLVVQTVGAASLPLPQAVTDRSQERLGYHARLAAAQVLDLKPGAKSRSPHGSLLSALPLHGPDAAMAAVPDGSLVLLRSQPPATARWLFLLFLQLQLDGG